jgi:TolA-binding protein
LKQCGQNPHNGGSFELANTSTEEEGAMSSDAPKPGTGLFGYRRSAVQEIMAEGDARLREAEERLRAAEMRVSELQQQIETLRRRNDKMSQQIEQVERFEEAETR